MPLQQHKANNDQLTTSSCHLFGKDQKNEITDTSSPNEFSLNSGWTQPEGQAEELSHTVEGCSHIK